MSKIKKLFKNKKWRWITLGTITTVPLAIISCAPQSQTININTNDKQVSNNVKQVEILKTQPKIQIEKSSNITLNKLNINFENLTTKQEKILIKDIYKSNIYKMLLALISITIIIISILIIAFVIRIVEKIVWEYNYRKEINKRKNSESSND